MSNNFQRDRIKRVGGQNYEWQLQEAQGVEKDSNAATYLLPNAAKSSPSKNKYSDDYIKAATTMPTTGNPAAAPTGTPTSPLVAAPAAAPASTPTDIPQGTPTQTPAVGESSYTHDQMLEFSKAVQGYSAQVDKLLETGSKEDLTALLEEIKNYGATLPKDEVGAAWLETITKLEGQLTNKISTMGSTTTSSLVVGDATSEGGEVTYEQYLRNYGGDSMKNYLASVKYANDDYYRSLMTYGMNAEALAGGGLTGAGVSSYGNDAAWAARQGAIANAGAVKQAADTETAKNYFNYVQNFKATQAAELKDKNAQRTKYLSDLIASGETNEETIKMLLGTTGLFTSEEIESYGKQIASGATSVVSAADKAAAETLFASTVESLGLKAAKEAVAQKYNNPDVAQEIYDEQVKIVSTAIMDIVNQYDPAKTDQDVIAKLTAYQKQGYLTEDELNGHIATIQQANEDYFGGLLADARDEYKAGNVLKTLGGDTVATEGEADSAESKASKLARDAVVAAYNKGDISLVDAVDMLSGDFFEEIDAVMETKKQGKWLQFICSDMIVWEEHGREMGNDTLYKELMQALTSKMDIDARKNTMSSGYTYYLYYDGNAIGRVDYFMPTDGNAGKLEYYCNGIRRVLQEEQARMLTNIYEAWKDQHNAQRVDEEANK